MNVTRYTLRNGLQAAYYRWPSESTAICIDSLGGSSFEPPGKEGIAHLVEHMIFKGSERLEGGELDRIVELSGGETNAYTSRELMVVCVEVINDHLIPVAEKMVEALTAEEFREEEFENEKRVVASEARGYRSAPDSWIYRLASKSLWGGSHLGRPIEGYPDSIEGIQLEDVVDYKARAFNPRRSSIAVVGGVDSDTASKVISLFESLEDHGDLGAPQPVDPSPDSLREERGLEAGYVAVSYPLPPRGRLLDRLGSVRGLSFNLGTGATSILYTIVREERGLAYAPATDLQVTMWGSTLMLLAFEADRDRIDDVVDVMTSIRGYLDEFMADEEWYRGRKNLYKYLTRPSVVSNTERADTLAASLILVGRPVTLEDLREETLKAEWVYEGLGRPGVAVIV